MCQTLPTYLAGITRIGQPGVGHQTDRAHLGVVMESIPFFAAYQVMRFRLFVVR